MNEHESRDTARSDAVRVVSAAFVSLAARVNDEEVAGVFGLSARNLGFPYYDRAGKRRNIRSRILASGRATFRGVQVAARFDSTLMESTSSRERENRTIATHLAV